MGNCDPMRRIMLSLIALGCVGLLFEVLRRVGRDPALAMDWIPIAALILIVLGEMIMGILRR